MDSPLNPKRVVGLVLLGLLPTPPPHSMEGGSNNAVLLPFLALFLDLDRSVGWGIELLDPAGLLSPESGHTRITLHFATADHNSWDVHPTDHPRQ